MQLRPVLLVSICLLLAVAASVSPVWAQTAQLSGLVKDASEAVIPNADITIVNEETGVRRTATSNAQGYYVVPFLQPGTYRISVQAAGFQLANRPGVTLNVGQQARIDFVLQVGTVAQTITVEGGAPLLNKESGAVSTVVDRQFVENLPLNGRSFTTLFEFTPGVNLFASTANANSSPDRGNISVNGQRVDANYVTIDGVSANVGANLFASAGQNESGSVLPQSVEGSTNNLVSIDALQEFEIQTSTYAAEFGRQPGGQISLVTRSGSNQFHGTLYEYLRNDKLDANNWFNNSQGLKNPPLRLNNFGGVVGGPIIKDRTFFFFSYEGLRLRQPKTIANSDVPSLSARQAAPAEMKPFLDVYPIPNGPDTINGFAQFSASFSEPSELNTPSIRVDHVVGSKLSIFGRYNHAPSEKDRRFGPVNNIFSSLAKTQTLTAGAILTITPQITNEFRANWSKVRGGAFFTFDDFGGGVPLPDSVLPAPFDPRTGFFFVAVGGSSAQLSLGRNNDNLQRQINLVDHLSFVKGAHSLKFGVDYRRLTPIIGLGDYLQGPIFNGITGPGGAPDPGTAISGLPSFVFLRAGPGDFFPLFTNFSAYAQDTWKVTPRFTLTYGLRWEVNPAPSEKNGNQPFTVEGLDNLSTLALAPQDTRLYETTYDNFAPRIGMAYQLSQRQGRETVLRGGGGLFYDLGNQQIAHAFGGFPLSNLQTLVGVSFPLDAATAAPPPFPVPLTPPFPFIEVADRNLKLPRTYQWNVAIEQSLGSNQTLSVSYVAAIGRRLVRREGLANPNPDFTSLLVHRNTGTSDYHSLQLQFKRRLSRGLQALVNYTWSHSIDIASSDTAQVLPGEIADPQQDRGSSNFDVRQAFSTAVTYNIPTPSVGSAAAALLRDWSLDTIVRARSATPVNVVASRFGSSLFGVGGVQRPDLVPGEPLYLDDPTAPGGRRFNRNAFVLPVGRQGTLGRNALRGFSFTQVDFAVRRQFNLTEQVKLQFRTDLFNVFNHPNFADPIRDLPSGSFGVSTQMFGNAVGGLSPIFQVGGPRSMQFALKLVF